MIDEELIAKMSADKDAVVVLRRYAGYLYFLCGHDLRDRSDEEMIRTMLEGAKQWHEAASATGVSAAEAAEALKKFGQVMREALPTTEESYAALSRRNANPNA